MLPRIKKLETQADFVLWVEFDDGVRVAYDVKGDGVVGEIGWEMGAEVKGR